MTGCLMNVKLEGMLKEVDVGISQEEQTEGSVRIVDIWVQI
jgi:hypothetical protein